MTAFLKIDDCKSCHRALPWEWTPAVFLGGRSLAGTGVWCSQLTDGVCSGCVSALQARREKERHALGIRKELIQLLGGEKPYREFTFERYQVSPGNQLAYQRSKQFNPALENLYLWGPCGVGKTHLSFASAKRCFEETLSVEILRPGRLSRKVRMKDPTDEQAAIDEIVSVEVL